MTTVYYCDVCADKRCEECPTPHGSRWTADDQLLPTCCCGRVWVER